MSRPEIRLLDLVPELSPRLFEEEPGALACDCYVAGVEQLGVPRPWGWSLAGGENIDHHAPVPAMAREISSANLALRWVAERSPEPSGPILLTHTDCDSVLTAGIVSGRLEADERYGAAAIAADHTGAENPIADLLQAIQDCRDVEYSFAMLALLEEGRPLPPEAQAALEVRHAKRATAAAVVRDGGLRPAGEGVWWAAFDKEIDGEFFPALLPEAELIVVGSPHLDEPERWAIKVRRGQAMAEGRTLDDLRLYQMDPAYGGRWNAGSTKRGGGSELAPEEWVRGLSSHLAGLGTRLDGQAG